MQGGHDEIVHDLDFVPALQPGRRLGHGRLGLGHVEPVFVLAEAGFDVANALEIFVEFIVVGFGKPALYTLGLREHCIQHTAFLSNSRLPLRQREVIGRKQFMKNL